MATFANDLRRAARLAAVGGLVLETLTARADGGPRTPSQALAFERAVRAAHAAVGELSPRWVADGHSRGGFVARAYGIHAEYPEFNPADMLDSRALRQPHRARELRLMDPTLKTLRRASSCPKLV